MIRYAQQLPIAIPRRTALALGLAASAGLATPSVAHAEVGNVKITVLYDEPIACAEAKPTNRFPDVQSPRTRLYAACASPVSAQALTRLVSRSIAAPSKASETGGLASCSPLRTKMLH